MFTTIFSIDDDPTTQFLNRYILESVHFCEHIIEANNGEDALSYYEELEKGIIPIENLPEIILLDLNMPVMDGWEFFELFKTRFPKFIEKTKVFVISSTINPDDNAKVKNEKNIEAIISKPLDTEKLHFIKSAIENKLSK